MIKPVVIKNLSIFSQVITKICIGFAILMAGFAFALFDLTTVFDIGFLTMVWIIFLGLFVILSVVTLIYVPFRIKRYSWKAVIPFVVLLALASSISPLTNLRARINLQAQKPDYEKIITLVESGALETNNHNGYIEPAPAPSSFIFVDQNSGTISVFFNTGFSVVVGSYTGFMYRSDDTYPPVDIMSVNQVECERAERNWFYCWSLY